MNRNEEYQNLKKDLEPTPPELEFVGRKAINRAKHSKRKALFWKAPIISFATAAIIFIMVINFIPSAAFAMSKLPIFRELIQVVAFDPSLKRAVENDYYQNIGKTQKKGNVEVTIDYMILDAGHISLFFHVNSPINHGRYSPSLKDSSGKDIPAGIAFQGSYKDGKMEVIEIDLLGEEYVLPSKLSLNLEIDDGAILPEDQSYEEQNENTESSSRDLTTSSGTKYTFHFNIPISKKFALTKKVKSIQESVKIEDTNVLVDRLEIYPSKACLYFDYSPDNSYILHDMDISIKDDSGKEYNPSGRLSGSYDDLGNIKLTNFESSYFTNAKQLTVLVKGYSLINKNELYGEIDYQKKTISNLPKSVSIKSMAPSEGDLNIILQYDADYTGIFAACVKSIYLDENGKGYNMPGCMIGNTNNRIEVSFTIKDYKAHKYRLQWDYAPMVKLDNPIEILVK